MMTLALFAEGVSDVGVFAHFIEQHTNLPKPLFYFNLKGETNMDAGKHVHYEYTQYPANPTTKTRKLKEFKSVKEAFIDTLASYGIKTPS